MKRQAKRKYALVLSMALALPSLAFGKVVYVKQDSTGVPRDGSSWDRAYHTIKDGVDAGSSGDEIWVPQGTYNIPENADEDPGDSFEGLSANAVDVLGREADLTYTSGVLKACHLTVLYLDGSVVQSPPNDLNYHLAGPESPFASRLTELREHQNVLVFANHPTKSGEVLSKEDLSAAANAGVLHAMEIVIPGDVDKWDYVLGNLPDTDSTKILWGLRADDTHYAELVDFACWTGAMMGIIETAEARSVKSRYFYQFFADFLTTWLVHDSL